jgi:hypothetical protein
MVSSQVPFPCHYSLRFTVRKANKPFLKTDTMFFKKKIWGTFHAMLSRKLRESVGAPTPFVTIARSHPKCLPLLSRKLPESVWAPHKLLNCENVCECEKAWANRVVLYQDFSLYGTTMQIVSDFIS